MLRFKLLSLLLALGIFASCEESVPECGELCITVDNEVGELLKFKSPSDPVFSLTVYGERGDVVRKVKDCSSTLTSPIRLAAGKYVLEASSGTIPAAAFDSPVYSGSTNASVAASKRTNASVTCTLANVKVSASFSPELTSAFPEYVLTVSNGKGSLAFSSADGSADRIGYFAPTGTLDWRLELIDASGSACKPLSGSCSNVKACEHYNLKFTAGGDSSIPFGGASITLVLDDGYCDKSYDMLLDFTADQLTETLAASDIWAMSAVLNGRWLASEQPGGLAFRYRKESETAWTNVDASKVQVNASAKSFSAKLTGIQAGTRYVYQAMCSDAQDLDEMTFTTEKAEILHNLSFDDWYQDGKVWYPNASSSFRVWDSANKGTSSMGVTPTTPESTVVAVSGPGKQAVKMESKKVMGMMLAAGNLYTGQFGSVSGLGAKLYWGIPFSSRPLALKGYAYYIPKIIDMAKDPYTGMKGKMDSGQIQIFLTDWNNQFEINTSDGVFVDISGDSHIIAHGEVIYDSDTQGYVEFTIPLQYRDTTRTPKYIVISCAASRFGDYFTGGVGSILYVDEFSLEYNPDNL